MWIRLAFAASAAALIPAGTAVAGRISHQLLLTTRTQLSTGSQRDAFWERWVATRPPYGLRVSSPGWGETEVGPCGSIQYVERNNLLRVAYHQAAPNDLRPYRAAITGALDPAREYRRLFRSRRISYRGATTFRGVAAYILIIGGRENSFTYVVRRDNYHPLRTIWRTPTYVETTTFMTFEYLSRTRQNNRLLHVGRHPGARVVRTGPRPRGTCARFGTNG